MITQQELNTLLWNAANSARGIVDASIFKDYSLAMLFYKYLSDMYKAELNELIKQYGDNPARIEMRKKNMRFHIPDGASFDDVFKQISQDNLGEIINKALHAIEEANGDHLKDIFTVDFNSQSILGQADQRNQMLSNLLRDFASIDLTEAGKSDILGKSYMYLLKQFASDAGKKAGEFFTPETVSRLLAKLAMPKTGDRICDPTCGSGSLLLMVGEEVGNDDFSLNGQEKVGSTYNLARMNMFIHHKENAEIKWGDTLNNPLLKDEDGLMKFEVVVANPPFSLDKWGYDNLEDDAYNRFHRGMPPKSKGDYAFISHMVEVAKEKVGRVAVIVPHGVLFRGASEAAIRKAFIEENILDAVIGLPSGLFQTTGIPVAILIFDKSRQQGGANEARKDILFIDASNEFIQNKTQNELSDEIINKIFTTYKERKEIEKYSHLASYDEVKENEYNLNIPRYVDTFEEEQQVDMKKVASKIEILEKELEAVKQEMQKHLQNLGL